MQTQTSTEHFTSGKHLTSGACLDPAMKIDNTEDAARYLAAYVDYIVREWGGNREDAHRDVPSQGRVCTGGGGGPALVSLKSCQWHSLAAVLLCSGC